ncbi:MAG TPA: TldD/PmbA family protein [Acidimicrobiales bacterium]|nr:TldD/PmbA family protein [Acidimicrobiales bacterium]
MTDLSIGRAASRTTERARGGGVPIGGTAELVELAQRVVDQARPGEELEVYVSRGIETDVRAYEGDVESLSSAASAGVGIRVLAGGRQGFAYAGSLDAAVVAETLADARDNVGFATPDPHVGLAIPDGVAAATVDVWDDGVIDTPTAVKVELALELERRVRAADPRVRQVASADYGDVAAEAAIATSAGIVASSRRTVCSLSAEAIAGTGLESQTGVGFSAGRSPGDLDISRASADAVERAVRLLGATRARTGKCAVVFDPRVSSTLLAIVSSALSGEAVTKGRSFFAGRLGEEVAGPSVTIVDDPTDARAFGASSYDAEGLACRRNVLIDGGMLRSFVFDTTSARRAGTTSTASAVRGGYATTPVAGCRALLLAPGALDAAAILADVDEALFVQSITGVHSGVNTVSGDFSVGAEGLMVRRGELAEPVREVTIASTLQRMLQSVLHAGADVEWLPGVAAGQTLAIDGMALSGA